jgi:hypothetical protein
MELLNVLSFKSGKTYVSNPDSLIRVCILTGLSRNRIESKNCNFKLIPVFKVIKDKR